MNSVVPALALPCEPSTAAVVTPTNAPESSTAFAPIHSPPRTMCSNPLPSGYSSEGERDVKLLPTKP